MNNINTLNIFKRYTDNYILKVDGLFNLLIRNTEDQLEKLEELLTKINSIYKEQIMKSYINYYEMCEDLMRKKNIR